MASYSNSWCSRDGRNPSDCKRLAGEERGKWYKWSGTSRWNHWGRRYAPEDRQRWEPRWSERRWPITDGEYLPASRAAGQVFEGVPQGDGVERRTRMHIGDIQIDRESCLASRTSLRYERPARMFRRRSQYPASGQRRPRQLAGDSEAAASAVGRG